MIEHITNALKPFTLFTASIAFKKANVSHAAPFSLHPLIPINIASSVNNIAARHFARRVDKVYVFTKRFNPNKLYIDNNSGIFLSPGIVLKFINLRQSRFLKKRLRTWYGYVKALNLLQRKPFILFFKDLNGKKSILLNKLRSSGTKVTWLLLRLFRNEHVFAAKKSRRIKRWIRKKYYQLEVGERR